jgi:hypothetical protein
MRRTCAALDNPIKRSGVDIKHREGMSLCENSLSHWAAGVTQPD